MQTNPVTGPRVVGQAVDAIVAPCALARSVEYAQINAPPMRSRGAALGRTLRFSASYTVFLLPSMSFGAYGFGLIVAVDNF